MVSVWVLARLLSPFCLLSLPPPLACPPPFSPFPLPLIRGLAHNLTCYPMPIATPLITRLLYLEASPFNHRRTGRKGSVRGGV